MPKQESLFEGYEEMKEGDVEETTIAEIHQGVLGDFKSKEYFEKVEADKREAARTQPAVQVVCANGCKIEIPLPTSKKFGPRSILASWMKTYHVFPAVGQKISTERDELGFFRVQLKQLR